MVFAVNASKRRHRSSSGGSCSNPGASAPLSSQDNQLFLTSLVLSSSGYSVTRYLSYAHQPPAPIWRRACVRCHPLGSNPLAAHTGATADRRVRSSKVQREVERPTSPNAAGPAAKRARMNVDYNVHYSGSRSVAQRLKQCSLKDLNNTSNGNLAFKTPSLPGCKPSPQLTPKQHNTVRIIAQYLRDLGLKESLDTLTEESGCKVENANARKLREAIYKAKWDDAIAVLEKCYSNLKPHQLETAKLIILEEKFYDLMHSNNTPMALRLLREEYPNTTAVWEKRTSMIRMLFMDKQQLSEVPEAMRFRTKKDRRKLVVKVQRVLPATFILPPARLEQLLNQAHITQVSKCRVHLKNDHFEGLEAADVFVDHSCQRRSSRGYINTQSITDHKCEVWCVEFSPDGKLLASCSKSSRVLIHSVVSGGKKVEILHHLAGYDTAEVVSCMSWSGDSKLLAIACTEQAPFDIMVFDAKEGRLLRTVDNLPNSLFTTCAFFNASNYFLIVGDERGHLQICDIKQPTESYVLGFWEGYRIRGVYGMSDSATVLASDTHHRLRRYRFDNRAEETIFTEEVPIISFRVHPTERFVLTTTQINLRMWDIWTKTLVRNFYGARQGNLVIHAGFGGINYEYIATGTEDNKVMIWCVDNSRYSLKLRGHKRMVNSVSWNPKYPTLLASCSQDGTVRIWNIARSDPRPNASTSKKKGHRRTGNHPSNGKEKRKRR
ncbi:WD domain, G-beta repeat protein [Dictyocaulus viviparus]|uniref:WD domain, G-beta repeat protein n=1 Tax=Dictyocaulus viviparus TaxID=29172 RepID=A0A0D8XV61_DICVI|nr:WD domain, G-beta repeat protein [Dictyocaulus viviparus]